MAAAYIDDFHPARLPCSRLHHYIDTHSLHHSLRPPPVSPPYLPPIEADPSTDFLPDAAIHFEHAYLRALIAGDRKSLPPRARTEIVVSGRRLDSAFDGVRVPKSALVSSGRGMRSFSSPALATTKSMANASLESVGEHDVSVPSSPPELSYSKSSKNSSSPSSDDDLSDTGLTERSSHFEDVALEDPERDSGEDCNLPPDNRPTLRRLPPQSLDVSKARRKSGISPQLHPIHNGQRQRYPSLQGAVSGVLRDQSLNLPHGRSAQRSATSPTSPYMRCSPQRAPSRSPSPGKAFTPNGYCFSPQALASATPKASYESPKENGALQRRPSWQPGRKTLKELEAEYNDEDEDVPDEAILENVPISPMPGQYSAFRSTSSLTLRSATPSPHRRPSYANLHSANIPKGAKRRSGPPPLHRHPRSPRDGRPPMPPHSATISSFPPDPRGNMHRSKSWTEDLSEEARKLSQALEEYAERLTLEKRSSVLNTPSSSPPRPSISKTRAKTCAVEVPTIAMPTIPPLQRGNIMIDPLPISKEKEAVLTRTRPSWLPPKSQKEERKHLREFQQMMARAAEAEKKRALKEQEDREHRKEVQGSIARIWEQHVLPNWDHVVRETRTRELWWRGVTPSNRGEVWQKAVGNELGLSATSFEAALARSKALEAELADMPDDERANRKEAAWMAAIARDVPRTFPELNMYQPGGTLHASLSNVLKAYTLYRTDVGYVYGTHLVAGILCLLLPAPEAFVLLANILNRPLPLAFLVHDQAAMARAHALTLHALKYKFPRLHAHLTTPALALQPHEYLDPLFRCLFAYNLPLEHVSRVWDIFVFEGDKTLVRAAVAVLGRLESRLYGTKEQILDTVGWRNEARLEVGSVEAFVRDVWEAGKVDERPGAAAAAAAAAGGGIRV